MTSLVVRSARSHSPSASSARTIHSRATAADVLAQMLAKKVRASAPLPLESAASPSNCQSRNSVALASSEARSGCGAAAEVPGKEASCKTALAYSPCSICALAMRLYALVSSVSGGSGRRRAERCAAGKRPPCVEHHDTHLDRSSAPPGNRQCTWRACPSSGEWPHDSASTWAP
eukprot:scaffold155332_cov34-Tisochrysis_lutea.AAC.2